MKHFNIPVKRSLVTDLLILNSEASYPYDFSSILSNMGMSTAPTPDMLKVDCGLCQSIMLLSTINHLSNTMKGTTSQVFREVVTGVSGDEFNYMVFNSIPPISVVDKENPIWSILDDIMVSNRYYPVIKEQVSEFILNIDDYLTECQYQPNIYSPLGIYITLPSFNRVKDISYGVTFDIELWLEDIL
jgi:hypothetical protein